MCLRLCGHHLWLVDADGHIRDDFIGITTEYLIERHTGTLTDNIMTCQIDGSLRRAGMGYRTIHHGIDRLDITWIHADQIRLQLLDRRNRTRQILTGDQWSRRSLSISEDSGVGLDLDETALSMSDQTQCDAERPYQRNLHLVGSDVRDFHNISLPFFIKSLYFLQTSQPEHMRRHRSGMHISVHFRYLSAPASAVHRCPVP